MRVIYNNIIPFKGFIAINLFGVLFVRKEYKDISPRTINHEAIHTAQMRELAYIGFYIVYIFEWLYRLVIHRETAYEGISFEREAYEHQYDMDYLGKRKHYAQWIEKH